MYKINSKKVACLNYFFTLKDGEELIDQVKLLKQKDLNFEDAIKLRGLDEETLYNEIQSNMDNEYHYPLLVLKEGFVGICIIYMGGSDDEIEGFYKLRDYTLLISDEEITSIVDKAVEAKIKTLKDSMKAMEEELSILEADD